MKSDFKINMQIYYRGNMFLLILLLLSLNGFSQNTIHFSNKFDIESHSSFVKPEYKDFFQVYDTVERDEGYVKRKLLYDDFISINDNDFTLVINPLVNFTVGKSSLKDPILYRNTRAVSVAGRIGNTVSFYSSFYENQLTAPCFIDRYVSLYGVLPGETNPKGFGDGGYDFGTVYGGVVWQGNQGSPFTFRLAFDEMFIGKGYRSLLLSNNGFPYYFVSAQYDSKKFYYLYSIASMQNPNMRNVMDIEGSHLNTSAYHKKTLAFHYLGYRVGDNISLGLFQATVFKVSDSSSVAFRAEWLNPVIISGPLCYGLEGDNNVILGAEASARVSNFLFYTQLVVDDIDFALGFSKQELAYQVGIHYLIGGIHFNGEYNRVNKGVYSHPQPLQSYTNFNQPLGIQSGQDLDELIIRLEYYYKRFYSEVIIINQHKRAASLRNVFRGQDNFIVDESESLMAIRSEISYIINRKTNLSIYTGIQSIRGIDEESYYYCGLRTSLRKISWDIFE